MLDIGTLVKDIDAIAIDHGITQRHDLDNLVGAAVRAYMRTKTYEAAVDAARTKAAEIGRQIASHAAIDQMIDAVKRHGSPLAAMQAL